MNIKRHAKSMQGAAAARFPNGPRALAACEGEKSACNLYKRFLLKQST